LLVNAILDKESLHEKIGISFLVLSLHPAWAGQFEVPTVEWLAVGLMMLALLIFFGKKAVHQAFACPNLTSKPFGMMSETLANASELMVKSESLSQAGSQYVELEQKAESYYQLGETHYHGLGVKRDDDLAVFYYTQAAQTGHQQAQYLLGCLYYYGTSVNQDRNIAVYWLTQSAEQNHAPAQYLLGFVYQYGLGVSCNPNEGLRWLTLAAYLTILFGTRGLDALKFENLTLRVAKRGKPFLVVSR
jgi:TPR repeat protein